MQANKPSKKKPFYQISPNLKSYLIKHNRLTILPIEYEDMKRYIANIPLIDQHGQDTFWQTVFYHENETKEIYHDLCKIYAYLNYDGDMDVIEHLSVSRIDFCVFGNSQPFRVRIINKLNDNYDHFYIKKVDASRIYGLELEDILSPNRVTYLLNEKTLIEEHIAGIPGDIFAKDHLEVSKFDQIRIAKEFIKFNERCFIRLLGDMRAYNFIVDITPDIEGSQYRIRAIDFDQQSYEGRKSFYLPQYFKENNSIILVGIKYLTAETVKQYQYEERTNIARRARSSSAKLNELLKCMQSDEISTNEKIQQLREELASHHRNDSFMQAKNMGELVSKNITLLIQKEFIHSMDSDFKR
jgi:hypothetical protein